MNSIRTKLLVAIISLFILSLGMLAGLNYWQAKNNVVQGVERELTITTESNSRQIGMWLDIRKTELNTLANSPILVSGNREAMVAYIKTEMRNNPLYENIFWTDDKGNYVDINGFTGSSVNRPYFKEAMTGKIAITDPILSPTTGKMVTVIALPIKNEGHITGLLVGAINVEHVVKTVTEAKVGHTGYAYLIKSDGTVVIHPDKEIMGKVNIKEDPNSTPALKAAVEKMVQGEKGVTSYQYKGVPKYLAYAPVPGTPWAMGMAVNEDEALQQLAALKWTSLVMIAAVLMLAIFAVIMLTNLMVKPLRTLEAVASRIAGGDLSISKIDIRSQDEVGRLAKVFETMSDNLRMLVRDISTSAEQVAAASEELTANAQQSEQAANQITDSVTSTAQELNQQVIAIDGMLSLIDKIATETHAETAKNQEAVKIAERAVAAVSAGNKAVDIAVGQMSSIRDTVDSSAKVVAELGDKSKEIGQIVETISGIAGQTNLLALNAAIEAARAGEQGRGFAVVAEEVRKLAEQSQEAAKQITVLIGNIQGKTEAAVTAMARGTQEVRRGTEVVDQAGRAFQEIDGHVREVANIAQGTANGLDCLNADSQKILAATHDIERISREVSDQAHTISAATQEQTASMEEIAHSSQHLAGLAEQLQVAVTKFKI
ncbi:MAG: mcpA 1 [Firmicutes bacterium]|nr:mcpA 1 [Bacillota bacterium]